MAHPGKEGLPTLWATHGQVLFERPHGANSGVLGIEDADLLHLPTFGGFGPTDFQVHAFGGEFYILYV
jgi:hypothetical protein